jgi:metallo-beta-lactamase family protein
MVLFVGYQAAGTRGRRMLQGEPMVRIHGQDVPVRAELRTVSGFSAHADREELSRWLEGFKAPPAQTLLVHGEPEALEAQRARLTSLGWSVQVPAHLERVPLAAEAAR